jgi:hypothetical protein
MKRLLVFFVLLFLTYPVFAQRNIQMRNIWTRPQVHVLFEGYTLSFTIKDINRALVLLAETGDTSFGRTSGLDTAKDHFCELYAGTRMEYRNSLQNLMQNGVGAFLLMAGHAYIENPKHKHMQQIIADIKVFPRGIRHAFIIFTDPRNGKRVFTGRMAANMYNKDLGIE